MNYKYKPKLADLIDRLSIDLLKSIFIIENNKDYKDEMRDILHDIDVVLAEKNVKFNSKMIFSILTMALTNREIWLNESKARKGKRSQNKYLQFTHSINGIRNTAKNIMSKEIGDRLDLKIDCLAAQFKKENFINKHGDWGIYEKENIQT